MIHFNTKQVCVPVLYLLLSALALSACGRSPNVTETASESAVPAVVAETEEPAPVEEPAPAAGQSFTSTLFDYSLEYPQGWIIKDRPGEWPDFDPMDPNRTGGIDAFAAYIDGRNLTFGVGARDLEPGETLETWEQAARDLIVAGVSKGVCYEATEDEPVVLNPIILDKEPGVFLEYTCPSDHDSYGLVVLAVHKGKGYWVTWITPQGQPAEDQLAFRAILETFKFKD